MKFYDKLKSPIGMISIEADKDAILSVLFKSSKEKLCPNQITRMCKKQLEEYFDGHRQKFDLQIKIQGTSFQAQVWNALLEIPFGKTSTYGNQARMIKKPNAARAVGAANGQNKINIIIPCHRVVGVNGALTGYRGGVERKKWLLEHESNNIKGSIK